MPKFWCTGKTKLVNCLKNRHHKIRVGSKREEKHRTMPSLSTWHASSSSTSSYSEILQSTTTLSAGDKDQLPIQSIQYHGTSCLELSVSSYKKVPLPSPFSRHLWKLNCSLLHTTRSNISPAAGASDSNSRHTVPPIKCFWHFTFAP